MATTNQNGSALLVMDIQQKMMDYLPNPEALLSNVAAAIAGARTAGIPVIYVSLSFRNGYPEISPENKGMSVVTQSGGWFTTGDPATAVHPAVAPQPNDVLVSKKRISAYAGSDLEMVLRAQHIKKLIITGYATSGVVLNTVRESTDKDYEQIVLSDACEDPDKDVHDFLMTKIFARYTTVSTTKEWLATL